MDNYSAANLKKGVFKWRSREPDNDATEGDPGSRWRRHDVSVALTLLLMTFVTVYKGDEGHIDRGEALMTNAVEIFLWLMIFWFFIRLLQGLRPHYFYYQRECIADMFEQKENDSFEQTRPPGGAVDQQGKTTVDSAVTHQCLELRPVSVQDSSAQTDGNHFLLDVKRTERNYQREMRRLRRQLWKTKQHMREQLKENHDILRKQGSQLSEYQFQLLPLEARKQCLLSEKNKLDEELRKEQTCRQDLLDRLKRLERQILSDSNGSALIQTTNATLQTCCSRHSDGKEFHADMQSNHTVIDKQSPCLEEPWTVDQSVTANKDSNAIESKQSVKHSVSFPERNKLRMLYSIERGVDDEVKYVHVTPMLFPLYEAGSELFPSEAVEQIEIVAHPHPDGTLQLLHISRYTDGFPREVLDSAAQYMDVTEFQISRGLPKQKSLNPSDVIFSTV